MDIEAVNPHTNPSGIGVGVKPHIAKLAKKYDLTLVVLFGSQTTGETHAKSDIDIGVTRSQPAWGEDNSLPLIDIEDGISDILRRDDVEVVDLHNISPALMRSIVEEGVALYEREPDEFAGWKSFAIRVWMETKWLRDRQREHLKEWAAKL